MNIYKLLLAIAVLMISCRTVNELTKDEPSKEIPQPAQKTNPFFAYNFGGLQDMAPEAQIAILKNNGYDGISLRMGKAKNVADLPKFIELTEKEENFKIYSVFVRYNFNDSDKDKNRWKEVVDLIKGKGIDLWFIFGKPAPGINGAYVESVMRSVVGYSVEKDVSVTIYPHSTCYFETAESVLPLVKKIDHPRFKLALHTCHELKGGNAGRLKEVVENVVDYVSFVTVAGASKEVDMTSPKTMDATTIQPLEDGVYDFTAFYKALKKANYKGPVGLINFKFSKEPDDYLPKSLQKWYEVKENYLNY